MVTVDLVKIMLKLACFFFILLVAAFCATYSWGHWLRVAKNVVSLVCLHGRCFMLHVFCVKGLEKIHSKSMFMSMTKVIFAKRGKKMCMASHISAMIAFLQNKFL